MFPGEDHILSDAAIRRIKPAAEPFKKADGLSLYLLVQPSGSRLWRMNYTFAGRQRTLAFGAYPDVSLAEARERRDAARKQLRDGVDPGAVVKVEKQAAAAAELNTFSAIGAEWYARKMAGERKSESTLRRAQWLLDILGAGIGDRPIDQIEAPELLAVLRRAEAQEKHEKVKRLRSTASEVFRFGIAIGACRRDPAADLRGALSSIASKPYPAVVDPAGVGELLRAIDGYPKPVIRLALQFLALVFTRPGNVCSAEWSAFDRTVGVWSISAAKMKMREPFRVPLSRQALAILEELHAITGTGKYLFPEPRRNNRPLEVYRLNVALRELGFDADVMQAHGFRSTFSTIANEHSEFSGDAIELALAHQPKGVRAIYNRSKKWSERCELVQWYADYLDGLRGRGEIVALPKAGAR